MTRADNENSVGTVDADSIFFSFEMSPSQEFLRKEQYNIGKPQIVLYQ